MLIGLPLFVDIIYELSKAKEEQFVLFLFDRPARDRYIAAMGAESQIFEKSLKIFSLRYLPCNK